MSALPNPAAVLDRAWRRVRRRPVPDRGLSVAVRLVVGFLVTLALVELVGVTIIDRNSRSNQIAQYTAMQRSDVRIFEAIGRRSLTTDGALRKIAAVLEVFGQRPGTIEAQVLNGRSTIVASGDAGVIGTVDADPRIGIAVATGRTYAGPEGDPRRDTRDLEFIAPVRLHSGRYAYEITYDHAALDGALASVHRALLLVGAGGVLAGGILFYLLGGRAVINRHRLALERATCDGMTSLPNQRAFSDELPDAVSSAGRYDEPLALAVLDIDDFRQMPPSTRPSAAAATRSSTTRRSARRSPSPRPEPRPRCAG
jgi:hypothetical protein